MMSDWLAIAVHWAKELAGDVYSKLTLSASTAVVWLGGVNWDMFFMIAGFLLGVITLGINWYYKHKNSKTYAEGVRQAAERGYVLNEPKE